MKMAGQRGRFRLTATEEWKYVYLGAFKGADASLFTGSFASLSPQKLQGESSSDGHTAHTQMCESFMSPALIYYWLC